MMNKFSSTFFLVLLLLFTCFAVSIAQVNEQDDDVVKINTNLVQLDAVVIDKKGNPVTNLKKEDFEIWQDGKLKELSNFSFVNTTVNARRTAPNVRSSDSPIPSSVRRKPNSTGRLVTFIIDDGACSSSLAGMSATRKAMTKYVNEQMFTYDQVAIYRTRSGASLLQQYTTDKEQLMRVIKKIRWYPNLGCSGSGEFFSAARQNDSAVLDRYEEGASADGLSTNERNQKQLQSVEDKNRDGQVIGTLGIIRYVVKGLSRIQGRKIVFVMSDGIPTLDADGKTQQARRMLQGLTEDANRAAVVLNTVDVRGVTIPGMITSGDDIKVTKDFSADKSSTRDVTDARRRQHRDNQDGMSFLARETGGRFYRGSNDLSVHLRRAMNIEKGYYLLGYEPDEETFKGTNFHKIEIKLKRPDLKVYSRAGFIGVVARKAEKSGGNKTTELYRALTAPLPNSGLEMRLTAFYGNNLENKGYIRCLIHIDGKNIEFKDDKEGFAKAMFDVVAVTLNQKNKVADEFNRTHTVRVSREAIPFIRKNGLTYTTDLTVKKPGIYNFRVAMRDLGSDLLGSATQVVKVPKLRTGSMFLSGLTVSEVGPNGKFESPSAKKAEQAISLVSSKGSPAIRSFGAGEKIAYAYTIYNSRIDQRIQEPSIVVALSLYREGELVFQGKPTPPRTGIQSDWTRIKIFGFLTLDKASKPGEYALKVVAQDLVGNKISSQWIDFEVVN